MMSFFKNNLLSTIFNKTALLKKDKEFPYNPKKDNLKTGQLGEKLAKRYLKRKGFRIIDKNYRTKFAEIDLIAQYKDILVFVEVRTKVGNQFGAPEESLNRKKINKVIKNAQMYIKYKNYTGKHRIDAICVVLSKNKKLIRLNHYKNITL